MNKELKKAIEWIEDRKAYIVQNCDLNDLDNKKAYDSLDMVSKYIDNSISKEVIEENKREKELQMQCATETSYDRNHLQGEIFALQELLESEE